MFHYQSLFVTWIELNENNKIFNIYYVFILYIYIRIYLFVE